MRTSLIKKLVLFFATCVLMGACQTTSPLKTTGDARIDNALQRAASKASKRGHKGQSLGYLEKLYSRNSDDAEAATNFAAGLREAGHLLRASTILAPFAKDPKSPAMAKNEFSAIQLAQGNYPSAEKYATVAVQQEPENHEAHHHLGIALDAQGKHEPAEISLRQAFNLWVGDPTTVMNNLALNLAAQEKLEEAVEILEQAQALSPKRVELERNLRIVRALQQSNGYALSVPKPETKPKL